MNAGCGEVIAHESIAAVLAGKEARGELSPARSEAWLKAMLYDNATTVYKLVL